MLLEPKKFAYQNNQELLFQFSRFYFYMKQFVKFVMKQMFVYLRFFGSNLKITPLSYHLNFTRYLMSVANDLTFQAVYQISYAPQKIFT